MIICIIPNFNIEIQYKLFGVVFFSCLALVDTDELDCIVKSV